MNKPLLSDDEELERERERRRIGIAMAAAMRNLGWSMYEVDRDESTKILAKIATLAEELHAAEYPWLAEAEAEYDQAVKAEAERREGRRRVAGHPGLPHAEGEAPKH